MLASLLPGFRELRTPLAAGYLWLACLWLAAGNTLAASELATRVGGFLTAAGPLASGTAITLAAYLIVVLSAAVTNYVLDRISQRRDRRVHGWISGSKGDYYTLLGKIAMSMPAVKQHEAATVHKRSGGAELVLYRPDGSSDVETTGDSAAIERAQGKFDAWIAEQPNPLDLDAVRASNAYTEYTDVYRQHFTLIRDDTDADQLVRFMVAKEISQRLRDNLPSLLNRLIGVEPDLYSAVDRQTAEGEFRAGVSMPAAALILTAGVSYEPVALLGLLVPAALFWLGLRRRHDALRTLAQTLYSGRSWSPVLGNTGASVPRTNGSTLTTTPNAS